MMARASGRRRLSAEIEAVAVLQPHIDHREGGRGTLELGEAVGDRFGGRDREAAAFHGAGEPLQK
jgi:hypothetical protein